MSCSKILEAWVKVYAIGNSSFSNIKFRQESGKTWIWQAGQDLDCNKSMACYVVGFHRESNKNEWRISNWM